MIAILGIQLFGKFSVRRNEHILDGLDARNIQDLFCYLLLHRDHSLPSEKLASILWPETTSAQSKKNLRHILWQPQTALGPQTKSVCIDTLYAHTHLANKWIPRSLI